MAKENRFSKSLQTKDSEKQKAIEQLTGKKAEASEEEETVPFNCNLPKSLHTRFKAKTKKEGRQMTWVIVQAIEKYLDE